MTINKKENNDLTQILHDLVFSYDSMVQTIKDINKIMGQAKMLSLNSSIEAARAGEAGRGFAIIAKEIKKFSLQSADANNKGLSTLKDLHGHINNVIGIQTSELAYNVIDKIDRNLFERFCDVQAWSTFEKIKIYAANPDKEKEEGMIELLNHLCKIYEVYHDIFMIDLNGNVIASAVNTNIIGKNVSEKEWFKNALSNNECSVSDMYYSDIINDYVVSYSCHITNSEGKNVGILSTRFNWNYIYDIIGKAKISSDGEIYVINKDGLVIASKNTSEILKLNIENKYRINDKLSDKDSYGFELEKDYDNNLTGIIGYAHGTGYNSYKGKDWSVIVKEPF